MTMRRVLSGLAAVTLLHAGEATAHPTGGHAQVATPEVSTAAIDFMVEVQVARGRAPDQSLRSEVAQLLQRRALMAREARRAGLAQGPRVRAELEVATHQILAAAWEARLRTQLAPREAEIRQRWETLRRLNSPATGPDGQADFQTMKARVAETILQERVDERIKALTELPATRRATSPAQSRPGR